NSGLLRMPSAQIRKVTIASYSVNPMTGTLDQAESIQLSQENGQWKSTAGAVKEGPVKAMAATLDTLKIVDARPKPPEMARDLREGKMQLSMQTALALRQFGFLLTQSGRILSSDGEMTVEMASGVAYQIRFGDVATTAADTSKAAAPGRYLFVTTS